MSKKALVRFSPNEPERGSSDFLAPIRDEHGAATLASLKSGKASGYGLVVYTGREVAPNDVFAKMVDSGLKIESVEATLADIGDFLEQVSSFKVGDVLELETDQGVKRGFVLRKSGLRATSSKPRP